MRRLLEERPRGRLLDDLPLVHDGSATRHAPDHVQVVADQQVGQRILLPQVEQQVLAFITNAGETYPLTQGERIGLGLPAQHETLTARELSAKLELNHDDPLRAWLDRPCEWGLVGQSGRTQATRYFVQPELLRSLAFPAVTTLKRIEDHRLQALVLEGLGRYPQSAIGDIHKRIGTEIARRRLQGMLAKLLDGGQIRIQGGRQRARYSLVP